MAAFEPQWRGRGATESSQTIHHTGAEAGSQARDLAKHLEQQSGWQYVETAQQ